MKPLLWKEMRDLRPWLLIGVVLTGAVYFLCLSESFKAFFWSFYWEMVMPLMATLAAVGLGASQVAHERHARTIDYLLARPVARVAVVWSKFIVGTVTLLLILGGLLWLGYTDPDYHGDEFTAMIRVQVGLWRMLPTLFLRSWCLYALALFLSVLVDRTSKAVVAAAVSAITLLGLIFAYTDIAPFKGFELWLPFFEFTGGLVRVASDASLFWKTSAALATFAMILGLGAATLFKRSAHRSLSTKVLALGGAGLIATAILAARISGGWLAVLPPVADVELQSQDEGERVVDMAANETLVCLAWEHSLTFVDFSVPAKPQTIAKLRIPLWTTSHVVLVGTTAYLVGIRKAIPTDEFQLIVAKPAGHDAIEVSLPKSLGPKDKNSDSFLGPVVRSGQFLYIGSADRRQYKVHVADLSTGPALREPVVVETIRDQSADSYLHGDWTPAPSLLRMSLQGSRLYVASPSALTTLDLGNPGKPIITGRIEFPERTPFYYLPYGIPHTLVSNRGRLYEAVPWPQYLRSYDLSDPNHPVAAENFAFHGTGSVINTDQMWWDQDLVAVGPHFYQPWRNGIIEFRPTRQKLEALRYLNVGCNVSRVVGTGHYVYALERANPYRIAAFRVQ
jgi:hypothetical protein